MSVRTTEVIEQLELFILIKRHHAVTHVSHMLLGACSMAELSVTEQAHFTQLDSLSAVSKEALKVDKALDIENREVMSPAHVIQVALDTVALMVTEEANS